MKESTRALKITILILSCEWGQTLVSVSVPACGALSKLFGINYSLHLLRVMQTPASRRPGLSLK